MRGGSSNLYLPEQPGAPSSRFGSLALGRTAYGAGTGGGYAVHYMPMFLGGGAHRPAPPTPLFIPAQQQPMLPPFGSVSGAWDMFDKAGQLRFADVAPYDYPGMMSGRGGGGYAGSVQHHPPPLGDMFSSFLDADNCRPPGRTGDVGRGNSMEWPSHNGAPVGRDRSIMEPGTFLLFSPSHFSIFFFLPFTYNTFSRPAPQPPDELARDMIRHVLATMAAVFMYQPMVVA